MYRLLPVAMLPVLIALVSAAPADTPLLHSGGVEPDFTFENDSLRLTVAPNGVLTGFFCKRLARDYHVASDMTPIVSVTRHGAPVPVRTVTRDGDKLIFHFVDPEVRATLRLVPRKTHFLIEVVSVEPADVEKLTVTFPVQRLATLGWAFGATYDQAFSACLFCAGVNSHNTPHYTADAAYLAGACQANHGLVGARWALIGAPYSQFKSAIIDAEQANGLPCPMLGGKWARDSASVHKSYLFATSVSEDQIDTLIQYAKIGHFGQIIFLKDSWLANHGHYAINRANFKGGLASLRRAADKIHAAGLEAGVHVFGPSLSPNDPYVTPTPDGGLACKALPPLAAALDEKTDVLTLAAAPEVNLQTQRYEGFPGYAVRLGDEIITYTTVEPGPPYRLSGCRRGAFGTRATAHAAGEPVKHLLAMWGFFAVDPDSPLAAEMATNFAGIINACDFDFVYFDASEGFMDAYGDRWYCQNKLHLAYYQKFRKPLLYQTSNGLGSDLLWHLVPRSASADGHGDLKGYLDQRWPGILGMANNWTGADIGWYYWFEDVRPDQIEYVCARVLGLDASFSMETSVEATNRLTQSRQMYEMLGRWEQARAEHAFSPAVRSKLLERQKDFKLFGPGGPGAPRWQLYRAAYEGPRIVDVLDGVQNVWTINNDTGQPCALGFELVRQGPGEAAEQGQPLLRVNGVQVPMPASLAPGEALCHEGVGGVKLWPGGMAPAQAIQVPLGALALRPGANRVELLWIDATQFPGNLAVLLYRVWPVEK